MTGGASRTTPIPFPGIGQPAAIARYRDSAYGLGVRTVTPAGIARITVFGGGPALAAKFGFPPLARRQRAFPRSARARMPSR